MRLDCISERGQKLFDRVELADSLTGGGDGQATKQAILERSIIRGIQARGLCLFQSLLRSALLI